MPSTTRRTTIRYNSQHPEASSAGNRAVSRKRQQVDANDEDKVASKRQPRSTKQVLRTRLLSYDSYCHSAKADIVLSCGSNDTGQLGYDREKCTKPRRLDNLPDGKFAQVVAGGMHSLVLTEDGQIYSWGCNDDGALGRSLKTVNDSMDEEDAARCPGLVAMSSSSSSIVMISAGDSHSAALTADGSVWGWGCFRDETSRMFLTEDLSKSSVPVILYQADSASTAVVKISSGCHHMAMLTADGNILTTGAGDVGQLGRFYVPAWCRRRAKVDPASFRPPGPIRYRKRRGKASIRFDNAFAVGYSTFVRFEDGHVLSFGLNNSDQLGIGSQETVEGVPVSFPSPADALLSLDSELEDVAGGMHHTLLRTKSGRLYGLGRGDDGLLGTGSSEWAKVPMAVALPEDVIVSYITGDTKTSMCVTDEGEIYSWGYNSNDQLGLGPVADDTDRIVEEPTIAKSNHLLEHKVIQARLGGQHALFAARRDS